MWRQIWSQLPPIGLTGYNHGYNTLCTIGPKFTFSVVKINKHHLVDIRPFRGGQEPNLAQKGHFGPKLLGPPEEARYQAKVCGDHESNPGGPIGGSWDQIWLSEAHHGPLGPQKGGNWLLFHSSDLVREGFWSSNIVILI